MEMSRCHGAADGVQWSLVKVTALTSHVTSVFVLKSASCIWSLSPSNMKFHIGGMGNLTTLCADHRWHCAHFSSLCFLLTLYPSHFGCFSFSLLLTLCAFHFVIGIIAHMTTHCTLHSGLKISNLASQMLVLTSAGGSSEGSNAHPNAQTHFRKKWRN